MPVRVDGETYYRTAEVCREAGISRTTLFRWLTEGIFEEPEHRDRRGWRLFTQREVNRLKAEANRVNKTVSLVPGNSELGSPPWQVRNDGWQ